MRYGFSGVYLDDITASPQWDIPVGATVPKYPPLSSWQAAMSSMLGWMASGLHANGLLAYANLCGTVIAPGLWQEWNVPLEGVAEEEWVDTGAGPACGRYLWGGRRATAVWPAADSR